MEGLITIQSNAGPEETLTRLEAEIKVRGMTVFARVNHAALAGEAGLPLRPTEVILFGNPRGGTPLMQASQTMGIDLPLKALVWQDESGKTWLSYNEPGWLAKRHGVQGLENVITAMSGALASIAANATGNAAGGPGNGLAPAAMEPKKTNIAPPPKEESGSANAIVEPARALSVLPLSPVNLMLRFIGIAAVVAGIACLFAYAGGWCSPRVLTPKRLADGFEQVNGIHPGFRRNHAKGVCVSGWFDSNGQGAALCKSSIFEQGRVPVIGRFSFAGGQPDVADAATIVRGLGIRFSPAHGEEWRTAMINLPVFPVSTPQAFYDLLFASAPDPATGKPDPAKMHAFLAKYPDSAKAFPIIQAQAKSSGFDNSTFNSLNVFAGRSSRYSRSRRRTQPLRLGRIKISCSTRSSRAFIASRCNGI
jgi:uncharacterized protein (DUF302 family)